MRTSFRWRALAGGAVGVGLVAVVVRSVMAGPLQNANAKDATEAAHDVKPAAGAASEERAKLPPGSWIAGNAVVEPADRETRVAAVTGGTVAAIRALEGDFVAKDQVLVELESRTAVAAFDAAEGELSLARAELARIAHGLRREDVDAIAHESASARARSELSASLLKRTEMLAKGGAIPEEELVKARFQAEIDAMNSGAADARRRAAVRGARVEDVVVARARVTVAEGRREEAKAAVDRLIVRAPIAGQVLQIKYRVGEYYDPGGPEALAILGDTRTLRVRMDVDERDIGRVKLGAPGLATASAFPGATFDGTVAEIGHRMGRKNVRSDDPTERIDTKILEVVLELKTGDRLVPGLRVTSYVQAGE